jgi:hypothetical protein
MASRHSASVLEQIPDPLESGPPITLVGRSCETADIFPQALPFAPKITSLHITNQIQRRKRSAKNSSQTSCSSTSSSRRGTLRPLFTPIDPWPSVFPESFRSVQCSAGLVPIVCPQGGLIPSPRRLPPGSSSRLPLSAICRTMTHPATPSLYANPRHNENPKAKNKKPRDSPELR